MANGDFNRILRVSTNGNRLVGNAKVKHPVIKYKTDTDENSFIAVDQIVGLEALTAEYDFTTYATAVAKQAGINNSSLVSLTSGGSFENEQGIPTSIKSLVEGKVTQAPSGWEQGATGKVESKAIVAVRHYRLEIGGEVIYDIDRDNDICIINGVDEMLAHRLLAG